jgi:peptide deformylase
MSAREILLLGNPLLYASSQKLSASDGDAARAVAEDLHDTLMEFRRVHGFGRAIAAPQIGVFIRMVYMHVGEPCALLNPVLEPIGHDTMDIWDDCMSFPGLLVRVRRFRRCRLSYRDFDGREHQRVVEGDLAELLQHECDHLDGVLAVQRAIDDRSFALKAGGAPDAWPQSRGPFTF